MARAGTGSETEESAESTGERGTSTPLQQGGKRKGQALACMQGPQHRLSKDGPGSRLHWIQSSETQLKLFHISESYVTQNNQRDVHQSPCLFQHFHLRMCCSFVHHPLAAMSPRMGALPEGDTQTKEVVRGNHESIHSSLIADPCHGLQRATHFLPPRIPVGRAQ